MLSTFQPVSFNFHKHPQAVGTGFPFSQTDQVSTRAVVPSAQGCSHSQGNSKANIRTQAYVAPLLGVPCSKHTKARTHYAEVEPGSTPKGLELFFTPAKEEIPMRNHRCAFCKRPLMSEGERAAASVRSQCTRGPRALGWHPLLIFLRAHP